MITDIQVVMGDYTSGPHSSAELQYRLEAGSKMVDSVPADLRSVAVTFLIAARFNDACYLLAEMEERINDLGTQLNELRDRLDSI